MVFIRGRHGGGGKKRGVENLTNDTPPKKGFWTPPSYGTFSTPLRSTPLRCQCSVFPVQISTTEQTRSSFGGVQTFSGERVLWYVFLPPYFLHPPISRPNFSVWVTSQGKETQSTMLFLCLLGTQGDSRDPDILKTVRVVNLLSIVHSLRIYPYPMVWPLPRPWSQSMVSDPPLSTETPRNKGFSGCGAPIFGFGLADPRAQG